MDDDSVIVGLLDEALIDHGNTTQTCRGLHCSAGTNRTRDTPAPRNEVDDCPRSVRRTEPIAVCVPCPLQPSTGEGTNADAIEGVCLFDQAQQRLENFVRFRIEVEPGPGELIQQLVDRRETAASIDGDVAELVPLPVTNLSGPLTHAIDDAVVECDHDAIGGELRIGFDVAVAEVMCGLERLDRVFGCLTCSTAVSYGDRVFCIEVGMRSHESIVPFARYDFGPRSNHHRHEWAITFASRLLRTESNRPRSVATSLGRMRRTKLVASLGPATDDPEVLRGIIRAGVDVARVNLSHGSVDEGMERFNLVRKIAAEEGRHVGVLADLPGPKVRTAVFTEESVFENGDRVRIVAGNKGSSASVIEVDYDDIVTSFVPGDRIVFGDGRLVLEVSEASVDELVAVVVHAGKLMGQPGVHVPADKLTMSTPTPHDLKLLDVFVEAGVDMVAISFVKSAHDMRRVGTEPHPRGPLLVAKIETRAAVENLEGIIEASGAIMVARGDLGNELPIEDLPITQKQIIERCIAGGKPVITATQMLESMITAPAPTRAEASDVANAVWDGSSAVMLSGETAVGVDPINVVRTMGRIARKADEVFDHEAWAHNVTALRMTESGSGHEVTDAMTVAAWRAVRELDVVAILCISGTGFTVRQMARFRPEALILGLSTDKKTINQLTMSWGTTPVYLPTAGTREEMMAEALVVAASEGHVRSGDQVALLGGDGIGAKITNNLRIVRVP